MELDITEWPVEILQFLVGESCEKDISVNEVISNTLEESFKNYDKQKQKS